MCFTREFVSNVIDAIEDAAHEDRCFTVTAKHLAKRTGVHEKTIREKYSDQGRIVGRALSFTEETAQEICQAVGTDLKDYTVTRQEAARRLGCHPDTVTRLMRNRGRLVGRVRHYREEDVNQLYGEMTARKLIDVAAVMKLLGCKTEQQLWYITLSAGLRLSPHLAYAMPYARWNSDLPLPCEMPRPDDGPRRTKVAHGHDFSMGGCISTGPIDVPR